MTEKPEDLLDFDHYLQKTHFKTASLLANSSRAVAILGGTGGGAVQLAYDYGEHLGLAFQLIDDVLARAGKTGSSLRARPGRRPDHSAEPLFASSLTLRSCAAGRELLVLISRDESQSPQDFTGSARTLGKPALNDLTEGLATAPTLFAAEQFPSLRPLIQRKFKGDGARREGGSGRSRPGSKRAESSRLSFLWAPLWLAAGDVAEARRCVEASEGVGRTRELAATHAAKARPMAPPSPRFA